MFRGKNNKKVGGAYIKLDLRKRENKIYDDDKNERKTRKKERICRELEILHFGVGGMVLFCG